MGAAVGVGYLLFQGAKQLFRSDGVSSNNNTTRNLRLVADKEWSDPMLYGNKYLKVVVYCVDEYISTERIEYESNSSNPYQIDGMLHSDKSLKGAMKYIADVYASRCN